MAATTTNNKSRTRTWCFTLNNPTELLTLPEETIKYAVWQKEQGAQGTPHYQGYIRFKSQRTFDQVRKLIPGAHLEVARGTDQDNRTYCTKVEGRLEGPWEIGELPDGQGKRNDWQDIKEMVKAQKTAEEIADKYPGQYVRHGPGIEMLRGVFTKKRTEMPMVWVMYGPPGYGKSHLAVETVGPSAYMKMPDKWWDGYEGQDAVIFDDFHGCFPYGEMKLLCDKREYRGQVKGRYVVVPATKIVITTNVWPEMWWDLSKEKIDWQAMVRRVNHWVYFTGPREYTVYTDYEEFKAQGVYNPRFEFAQGGAQVVGFRGNAN